jgi:hypothetical protein
MGRAGLSEMPRPRVGRREVRIVAPSPARQLNLSDRLPDSGHAGLQAAASAGPLLETTYLRRSAGRSLSGRSSEGDIPVTAATARSFLRGIRAYCLIPLALVGLPMAVSLRARAAGPPALAIARATGSVEDDIEQTPNCPLTLRGSA